MQSSRLGLHIVLGKFSSPAFFVLQKEVWLSSLSLATLLFNWRLGQGFLNCVLDFVAKDFDGSDRSSRTIKFTGTTANAFFSINGWLFDFTIANQGYGSGWAIALAGLAGDFVFIDETEPKINASSANLNGAFFKRG